MFTDQQGARAASRNLSSKLHKLDQESLKQQEIIYMQVRVGKTLLLRAYLLLVIYFIVLERILLKCAERYFVLH